jgi:hypothetical protein
MFMKCWLRLRQEHIFQSEHGEPPKITAQPQSTWLWLSQLIRRVGLSGSLFSRGAQGARGCRGIARFFWGSNLKVLTIREGYGSP